MTAVLWVAMLSGCSDDAPGNETDAGGSTDAETESIATSDGASSSTGTPTTSGPATTATTDDGSTTNEATSETGTSVGDTSPTPEDDQLFTAQNESLAVGIGDGLLANDSDPQGDPLAVTSFDATSTGGATVTVQADGSATYSPAVDFWGPDTFTYTVENGAGEFSAAMVTVFVAPRRIALTDVAAGHGGFAVEGEDMDDRSGTSVSGAGDINGDGFADIVVGAPYAAANGDASGRAYVVFGKSDTNVVDLSALGTGGFTLDGGSAGDTVGLSVSGAGDVNDDGLADIIVGAPGVSANGNLAAGRSYVVFGKSDANAVDLGSLGAGGFAITGAAIDDTSGASVSEAGDVNGDGLADVVVGAPDAPAGQQEGRSYVVFGKTDTTDVELGTLGDGGFMIAGELVGDSAGVAVSTAGDVNADGRADLIVGAHQADSNAEDAGRCYLVFGKADTQTVDLSALASGGIVLNGGARDDEAGTTVSGAGDINGDGIPDIVVGAHRLDANSMSLVGRSYVVFGTDETSAIELANLGAGGFTLTGAASFDNLGRSVSGAGDLNADGLDDIVVGMPRSLADGRSPGQAIVVYGKADGNDVPVASLGARGFILEGEFDQDVTGASVSGAGDVNGDGVDDIIVSASYGGLGAAGRTYVVFGVRTQ